MPRNTPNSVVSYFFGFLDRYKKREGAVVNEAFVSGCLILLFWIIFSLRHQGKQPLRTNIHRNSVGWREPSCIKTDATQHYPHLASETNHIWWNLLKQKIEKPVQRAAHNQYCRTWKYKGNRGIGHQTSQTFARQTPLSRVNGRTRIAQPKMGLKDMIPHLVRLSLKTLGIEHANIFVDSVDGINDNMGVPIASANLHTVTNIPVIIRVSKTRYTSQDRLTTLVSVH